MHHYVTLAGFRSHSSYPKHRYSILPHSPHPRPPHLPHPTVRHRRRLQAALLRASRRRRAPPSAPGIKVCAPGIKVAPYPANISLCSVLDLA